MTAFAPEGLPLFSEGDDLAEILMNHIRCNEQQDIQSWDVVIFAQKIVSKSEGREVPLRDVVPSAQASLLAKEAKKDPRLVELILSESREVIRVRPGLIIVENKHGMVLANAGIDRSNVGINDDDPHVLLLPENSQRSADQLRMRFADLTGRNVAIIINDSIGRAWRNGTVGTALGVSGLGSVEDLRGREDLYGRAMETSMVATADQIASMAALLQGECDEGRPVVICRGLQRFFGGGDVEDLIRPPLQDLFR